MSARTQSPAEQEALQETDHVSQTLSQVCLYPRRMIQAARLFLGLLPLSSASCDLPVGQIEELTLPNARSKKETWATAFGVSPEEWRSIVAVVPALELRSLLEKGYTDWASHLLAEESTSLDLPVRKDQKRLQTVKALTQAVLTSSSLGAIFGNRQLVEASAAYFLLGFSAEKAGTLQNMEMLWKLHNRFGILDQSSKKNRACTERLHRAVVEPQDLQLGRLCRCEQFWVCGEDGLIRVTLSKPKGVIENLDEALDFEVVPLRGVRILEFHSGRLFHKSILKKLLSFFPNVRVMTVRMQQEPVDVLALQSWTASVFGLSVIIASTVLPDWICEFRDLRYLDISGNDRIEDGEHISIKALPDCLGNLSELLHLNVVGCNLTGHASLPSSLGNLQKLRIFEAFENGRLSETQGDCPPAWLPNRSQCVPGYVAQEDGTEAVWRCPVHGWNIRFDDLTLPWWRWQAIEKMHIDANFIYGGIPETLPEHWPKLRSLDLHDLKLEGPLPQSLERLENLTQLQVQMNDLDCHQGIHGVDVVARLMKHPKLRNFNIDANRKLCGCLPSVALPHLSVKYGGTSARICDNFAEL
eukprot:s541_g11.t1